MIPQLSMKSMAKQSIVIVDSAGKYYYDTMDVSDNNNFVAMVETPTNSKNVLLFKSMSKNVNIYWIGATTLAIWFLFIHSPPILWKRRVWEDAPFLSHLIGAYSIYLACICNTLVTPSIKRHVHIWVGRIGLILGMYGFFAGLYLCFWPWRPNLPPLEFSMGITIGGIGQIILQIWGYLRIKKFQSIRDQLLILAQTTSSENVLNSDVGPGTSISSTVDATPAMESDVLLLNTTQANRDELEQEKQKALCDHISAMISLFVIACGVPAAIRLADIFGAADGNSTLIALIVIFSVVSAMYQKSFLKRITTQ